MNQILKFNKEVEDNIVKMSKDEEIKRLSYKWIEDTAEYKYSYNFKWMGRPIIQFPQDIMAMQELIWDIKPDLIIETGIAHGGSLIFYASMMELIGKGEIIGIDIDIRKHNKEEIEKHPMYKRIKMIEGSSVDVKIFKEIEKLAESKKNIMVILDSNHTHNHVLQELKLYSPLVTKGSYLIVFDTIVDDMPKVVHKNRPWGPGNNPKTAVKEFLKDNDRFTINQDIENKLLITVSPSGYLKCIKD